MWLSGAAAQCQPTHISRTVSSTAFRKVLALTPSLAMKDTIRSRDSGVARLRSSRSSEREKALPIRRSMFATASTNVAPSCTQQTARWRYSFSSAACVAKRETGGFPEAAGKKRTNLGVEARVARLGHSIRNPVHQLHPRLHWRPLAEVPQELAHLHPRHVLLAVLLLPSHQAADFNWRLRLQHVRLHHLQPVRKVPSTFRDPLVTHVQQGAHTMLPRQDVQLSTWERDKGCGTM
jgi:hypothetical protein